MFGDKLENPYNSKHYKFSDNLIQFQNAINRILESLKPLKTQQNLELTSNFTFS